MDTEDFRNVYVNIPSIPSSNNEKELQNYLQSFDQIFHKNEVAFINKSLKTYSSDEQHNVANRYRYVLKDEIDKLTKAEEKYSSLFNTNYQSKRQIKNTKIQQLLPYLERIDYRAFSIIGWKKVSIISDKENMVIITESLHQKHKNKRITSKKEVLQLLLNLNMGYWAEQYTSNAIIIYDGIEWNLDFTFIKNNKKYNLKFSGKSCFPHNFDKLYKIINE